MVERYNTCIDWECTGGGGGIIVDPGFGGGGIMPGGRRLEEVSPPAPEPDSNQYAYCAVACSMSNIYSCNTEADCTSVGGQWTASSGFDGGLDGGPELRGRRAQVLGGGYCSQGCSIQNPYQCQTEADCTAIAGSWTTRDPEEGGGTYCDLTDAGCDIELFVSVCSSSVADTDTTAALCSTDCGSFLTDNYERCQNDPPSGMTSASWQERFGPIVTMCQTFQADPELSQCVNNAQTATDTLQRVCCSDGSCDANGGVPTHCTGACADVFLPYFEACGPILMGDDSASTLGSFYQVCTATGSGELNDPHLCTDNNGKSPWTAIEFRNQCQIWIKYVPVGQSAAIADFVQLIAVEGVNVAELQDNARTVCGTLHMVERLAEDFSGIMAISGIPEHNHLSLTINHPSTGNEVVQVKNNQHNRQQVRNSWEDSYDVNVFSPDNCPSTSFGR